jgi:uncharacterized membrane protein YecN with MAPEG domain
MPVFFVCAGLLGLLTVALSLHVGRLRGAKKIFLGDGGDPEMLAAIRAHANLVEFAPICLLLIYLAADFYGFRVTAILSVVLLVARALHAGGILGVIPMGRTLGAIGTIVVLAVAGILLVVAGVGLRQY